MIDFECCFFRISYYIRKRDCIKKGWEISTENRRMTVFDTGDGLKGIECIPKSEWWTYLKHYLKKENQK